MFLILREVALNNISLLSLFERAVITENRVRVPDKIESITNRSEARRSDVFLVGFLDTYLPPNKKDIVALLHWGVRTESPGYDVLADDGTLSG